MCSFGSDKGSGGRVVALSFLLVFLLLLATVIHAAQSQASGPVSFVGSAFNGSARGSETLTIDRPGGVAAGDVMVAMLGGDYSIPGSSPGWTKYAERNENLDLTGQAFYKVATGDEPSSYTWPIIGGSSKKIASGTIVVFRGADPDDPMFSFAINGETTGTNSFSDCPSTDGVAGGALVCVWIHDDPQRPQAPTGMVPLSVFTIPGLTGNDDGHATAYKLLTNDGPTGVQAAALSSSVSGGGNDMALAVVVRPYTLDTTAPVVGVTWATLVTNTSDFDLIFTATDDVGVSECRYELDGISTPLPGCSNTVLTSVSLEPHQLQVFATDTSGNTGSSPLIGFTVTDDVSPPQWNPVPVNQTIRDDELLSYQVNAVDNHSVAYSVSDTTNFTINPTTGLLVSNTILPLGDYPITISVQDNTTNRISADITITVTATPPPAAFFDDFDDGDLGEYGQLVGNWGTVVESGRGLVLRQTANGETVFFAQSESFSGSYQVKAVIWNEDNDNVGVAFGVNTADADNFYSCSATADNGFQAGIWRHVNDLRGTPTTLLAGVSWNYVTSRWYTVTITVDQTANTIQCQWESAEAGVELDVTSVDPGPSTGSVGIWLSRQDNFKGDLLEVSSLGPRLR